MNKNMKEKYRGQSLSNEEVNLIVESINSSKAQYQKMFLKENLSTSNGKDLHRWNYIFGNIKNSFNHKPFEIINFTRSYLWSFIGVFNKEEKILYLLVKESNFKNLQKDFNNKKHYLKLINYINNGMDYVIDEQLSLLEHNYLEEEIIKRESDKILEVIKNEAKCCKTIIFKENINGVTNISENIVDNELNIIDKYNLTELIVADINNILDTQDSKEVKTQEITLNIRKNIINKNKDKEIIIKNKKQNIKDLNDI